MPKTDGQSITKWNEPSIISVIFAPRPANESSTSFELRCERAPADWLAEAAPFYIRIVNSLTLAFRMNLELMRQHVRQTVTLSREAAFEEILQMKSRQPSGIAPGRKFPFASHLDLVSYSTEGLEFDADDYREV